MTAHRNLPRLLAEARTRVERMTPAERAEMHEAQRESWVRGEMGMERETEDRMTTITNDMVEAAHEAFDRANDYREVVRFKAMRAALEAAERAAWRDISTAPRDGTPVLLWAGDYGAVWGWWDAEELSFYRSDPTCRSYDPDSRRGDWVSCFFPDKDDGDRRLYCGATPTHWRPITPPGRPDDDLFPEQRPLPAGPED